MVLKFVSNAFFESWIFKESARGIDSMSWLIGGRSGRGIDVKDGDVIGVDKVLFFELEM